MPEVILASNSELLTRETVNRARFPGKQLAQLVLFPGYKLIKNKPELEDFTALGGAINEEERQDLKKFSRLLQNSGDEPHEFYCGNSLLGLGYLAECLHQEGAARVLKKLSQWADLHIITGQDIVNRASFENLSRFSQFVLSRTDKKRFRQLQNFLDNGGILSVIQFKQPTPNYLATVKKIGNGELMLWEKATAARNSNELTVVKPRHEFITAIFINQTSSKADQSLINNLGNHINKGIDKGIETVYADMTLTKTLIAKELQGVAFAMLALGGAMPLLYWLNEQGKDKFLSQVIIKTIPPFISDMVTMFSQLALTLEGNSFPEKAKDFGRKVLESHRRSGGINIALFALGPTLSELIAERLGDFWGAIAYSLIPFAGTLAITADSVKRYQKKHNKDNFLHSLVNLLSNDPLQFGVNMGALLSSVTGIAWLGFNGRFRDPASLAFIEGAEEHTLGALFANVHLYTKSSFQLQTWMKKEIDDWKKDVY